MYWHFQFPIVEAEEESLNWIPISLDRPLMYLLIWHLLPPVANSIKQLFPILLTLVFQCLPQGRGFQCTSFFVTSTLPGSPPPLPTQISLSPLWYSEKLSSPALCSWEHLLLGASRYFPFYFHIHLIYLVLWSLSLCDSDLGVEYWPMSLTGSVYLQP